LEKIMVSRTIDNNEITIKGDVFFFIEF